jgi:PHP family Zn ribbon phosphoesterase
MYFLLLKWGVLVPYKICPYCEKTSYSAADAASVKWLCPYCEKDISHVEGVASLPKKQNSDNQT